MNAITTLIFFLILLYAISYFTISPLTREHHLAIIVTALVLTLITMRICRRSSKDLYYLLSNETSYYPDDSDINISNGVMSSGKTEYMSTGGPLLQITPGKLCRGGWYMHQGDSPEAQFCQNMEQKTPDEIRRFTCGKGFINMPSYPEFKYETSITYP